MNKREYAGYLCSMFICVIASHATMVVDAAVGGNLLGQDAVSAVDLVMPVYELFYVLVLLFGMGAGTAAALALGKGDVEAVRKHFTGAIISILALILPLGVGIWSFRGTLAHWLCEDAALTMLTQKYLCAMIPFFVIAGVQITGMIFTALSGYPGVVMCSSLVQFAVNLSCNWLLIKGAKLGIEALAYSSGISSLAGLLVILPGYCKSNYPFKWLLCPPKQLLEYVKCNVRYGLGFIAVDTAYMLMAYFMNTLVLKFQGKEALFGWSVTMMIYLTGDYAATAANETSVSLGARYLGAGDRKGAEAVYNWSLVFAAMWLVLILAAVFAFPGWMLPLFGAAEPETHSRMLAALLLNLPFVAGINLVNLYLVRLVPAGAIRRYSLLSAALFLSVPGMLGLFQLLCPEQNKYALLALLPVQIALCLAGHRKNHD